MASSVTQQRLAPKLESRKLPPGVSIDLIERIATALAATQPPAGSSIAIPKWAPQTIDGIIAGKMNDVVYVMVVGDPFYTNVYCGHTHSAIRAAVLTALTFPSGGR